MPNSPKGQYQSVYNDFSWRGINPSIQPNSCSCLDIKQQVKFMYSYINISCISICVSCCAVAHPHMQYYIRFWIRPRLCTWLWVVLSIWQCWHATRIWPRLCTWLWVVLSIWQCWLATSLIKIVHMELEHRCKEYINISVKHNTSNVIFPVQLRLWMNQSYDDITTFALPATLCLICKTYTDTNIEGSCMAITPFILDERP